MQTNYARLTSEQKTIWSMDFWKNARNASFINKFLGKGPNSLVQHITELKQSEKGARAVITLLADLVAGAVGLAAGFAEGCFATGFAAGAGALVVLAPPAS